MASAMTESDVVRVRASGKINLALRSGPRRPDGYHSLATVFQAVSIHDDLEARWSRPGEFSVSVSGEQAAQVPTGPTNLAVKAARLLAREAGTPNLGCELSIRKAIPVTGGMAGGSADAAAALLACSVLWDLDVSPDELGVLGARLGADVPFCLTGGTALGTDRGDQLAPVLSRGSYHWVLALSDTELSTPEVFGRFDAIARRPAAPLEVPAELLNALIGGDPVALGRSLVNDLEEAAFSLRPQLERVRDAGLGLGAVGAVVSGSGPTLAFLATDENAAIDLSTKLSAAQLCRAVKRVQGPVPGVRLLN